jgi:transposase-like protein
MNERKYRTHPKYTIEQKNEIVILYLNKELSQTNIVNQFDIHHSLLQKWVKQYRELGRIEGCPSFSTIYRWIH